VAKLHLASVTSWWIKLPRIHSGLPNLLKFSPVKVLCYMEDHSIALHAWLMDLVADHTAKYSDDYRTSFIPIVKIDCKDFPSVCKCSYLDLACSEVKQE